MRKYKYHPETISDIKARMKPLIDKQQRRERLSQAEARQLAEDGKILVDLVVERDSLPPTALEMRSAVAEQVRDAVSRGIVPLLSSEPGGIVKPPRGHDPMDGRKCMGPGKPGRWGKPGTCGRQAFFVLRRGHYEAPKGAENIALDAASATRAHAYAMYGLGDGGMVPLAMGTRMGHQIPDMQGPPRDGDDLRCQWHSYQSNIDAVHPDDDDTPPTPKPTAPPVRYGMEGLDLTRQIRMEAGDGNLISLTDGINTVLCRTSEYIAWLKANGSLPRPGQSL